MTTVEAKKDNNEKNIIGSVRVLNDELIKVHSKFKDHQVTAEIHSTAKDCLKSLKRIDNKTPITDTILQELNVGKTVAKFRKTLSKKGDEQELLYLATQLIEMWTLRHRMKIMREGLDAIHKKWKTNGHDNLDNRNDDDVKTAKEILQKLGEMNIPLELLFEKPLIGKMVKKFEGYDSTRMLARSLVDKWSELAKQITGRALEALTAFRKREQELNSQGRKKPDMIAFKELRSLFLPSRRKHGKIPGVPVGISLNGRGEAAILGIHQNILSGIDSVKDEPCYAVCISGKYEDEDVVVNTNTSNNNNNDKADSNDDGTILYTGSGGQKNGRQVEDQIENTANTSLIQSSLSGHAIRVLRRKQRKVSDKPEYYYEGLYTCTGYKYERSSDGPKIYKFVLKPVEGQSQRSSTTAMSQTSTRQEGRMKGGGQVRDRLKKKF